MKINKITLYNFSSYEGLNEFDFSSSDEKKNIILIGGKNGAGKTSLFTAIKLALYGSLAYGYIGFNTHYISRIKDCINSKAFQTDHVESWVKISLSFVIEREVKEYEVTRKWIYRGKKLAEEYEVAQDGKRLDEQEVSYFQNYLQSLIPPDLFEMFLFDGEEVGAIFSTSTYHTYVKKAIYTLCGLDIYELLRRQTSGYTGNAESESEQELHAAHAELKNQVSELEEELCILTEEIAQDQDKLEEIDNQLLENETAFKNAGGITEEERKKLKTQYEKAEKEKTEAATQIKGFVEEWMPFYIAGDFRDKIAQQLEQEEKSEIFHYVQKKIQKSDIRSALGEAVSEDAVEGLMTMLTETFRPEGETDESEAVYDLSKEESNRVLTMITNLDTFDTDKIIACIRRKQQASDCTAEINRQLKSAMEEEDASSYTLKENDLLKQKTDLSLRLREAREKRDRLQLQKEEAILLRDKAWKRIEEESQNRNVMRLSAGVSAMMKELLAEKTIRIRKQLEHQIVENLNKIYRKNNLITHIEIREDFQFYLYQDAVFKTEELLHLMNNVGNENFALIIGKKSQNILFEKYEAHSFGELQKKLVEDAAGELSLYKNIELSRLSKGERQIFILALYWAIIDLSGQDIPFVIDTPYARIDANHRREISEKFFPNISKQVIILSTDEEINEEYYDIIKPYIAKEYLLLNEENQNRTTVENHYFFGDQI